MDLFTTLTELSKIPMMEQRLTQLKVMLELSTIKSIITNIIMNPMMMILRRNPEELTIKSTITTQKRRKRLL